MEVWLAWFWWRGGGAAEDIVELSAKERDVNAGEEMRISWPLRPQREQTRGAEMPEGTPSLTHIRPHAHHPPRRCHTRGNRIRPGTPHCSYVCLPLSKCIKRGLVQMGNLITGSPHASSSSWLCGMYRCLECGAIKQVSCAHIGPLQALYGAPHLALLWMCSCGWGLEL